MKKLMLSLGLSGLMFIGFAQEKDLTKHKEFAKERKAHRKEFQLDQKSAEEIAQLRTDRLDEKLKFTDLQKKEIYTFQLEQAVSDKKNFAERKLQRERLKKERVLQQERLLAQLTPEQQKRYKDSFAENRKQQVGRRADDRPSRRDRIRKGEKVDVKRDVPVKDVSNAIS